MYRFKIQFLPITHIYDGSECCCSYVGADGAEDRPADLPDVSALLGQQGQQDVDHHLHPLWLLFVHSCNTFMLQVELIIILKVGADYLNRSYSASPCCFFFLLVFFSWALSMQLCRSFIMSSTSSGALRTEKFKLNIWTLKATEILSCSRVSKSAQNFVDIPYSSKNKQTIYVFFSIDEEMQLKSCE